MRKAALVGVAVALVITGCGAVATSKAPQAAQQKQTAQTNTTAAASSTASASVLNLYAGNHATTDFCGLTASITPPGATLVDAYLLLQKADLSGYVMEDAQSITSPDGKLWTINLRPGVKWQDGQPLTANDVVFSLNLVTNPKAASIYSGFYSDIEGYAAYSTGKASRLAGVKAINPETVQITLSHPSAGFLSILASLTVWPEHILGSIPPSQVCKSDYWSQDRIGTGPYKWYKYVSGQRVELRASPTYWRGEPKIQQVNDYVFSSTETALAAYQKGQLSEVEVPANSLAYARTLPATDLISVTDPVVRGLYPNEMVKAFQNPLVRQAIAYAINRNAIIKNLAHGTYQPMYSQFMQPWTIPSGLNKYPYDPAKARQLLKQAHWTNSRVYTLLYYYSSQTTANIMTFIQQELAAVGIRVNPVLVQPAALRAKINPGKFDILYAAIGGSDPSDLISDIDCGYAPPTGNNFARICNHQVSSLMQQGAEVVNQAQRDQIYQKISSILNAQLPIVYLWSPKVFYAFHTNVTGFQGHWSSVNARVYTAIQDWTVKN